MPTPRPISTLLRLGHVFFPLQGPAQVYGERCVFLSRRSVNRGDHRVRAAKLAEVEFCSIRLDVAALKGVVG